MFQIKTRCTEVMFKMRNNSTTEMNFRCVEVRVRKQEDFLAKPEQEEGVGGGGGGGPHLAK